MVFTLLVVLQSPAAKISFHEFNIIMQKLKRSGYTFTNWKKKTDYDVGNVF